MSTNFILGLVFLSLAAISVASKKGFFEVPLSELKKRRTIGEEVPKELLESLSYSLSLRTLLWLLTGLTSAASVSLLARSLPIWLGIILIAIIVYFLFSYLPKTRTTNFDRKLASLLSPGFNWLLKRTSKYLNIVHSPLAGIYVAGTNKIFDNQDLLEFIKNLSKKESHRIKPEVLLSLERSLAFESRRVIELMVPAKKVKTLLETDVIGPILINDLHESKEGYAFVRSEAKGPVTGLITFNDLSIKSQGRVSGHMRKEVHFINQNDSVYEVIRAFYETTGTLFVVVNDDQKFVGAISLEDVIKQLTGPLAPAKTENSSQAIAKTDEEVVE